MIGSRPKSNTELENTIKYIIFVDALARNVEDKEQLINFL